MGIYEFNIKSEDFPFKKPIVKLTILDRGIIDLGDLDIYEGGWRVDNTFATLCIGIASLYPLSNEESNFSTFIMSTVDKNERDLSIKKYIDNVT